MIVTIAIVMFLGGLISGVLLTEYEQKKNKKTSMLDLHYDKYTNY